MTSPKDLFIITTAKKRDSCEWMDECAVFGLSTQNSKNNNGMVHVNVDSWNNIKKYVNVQNAFFIFDEQRVVGYGAWTKAFLRITKQNQWILLSATPGDTWTDYIPVFIANGFYKSKSDFNAQHCVFSRFAKYPKIERFVGVDVLRKHRHDILIKMEYVRQTEKHDVLVPVEYDKALYRSVLIDRWDPYDDEPIQETGKLCYLLRKVVNTDSSRRHAAADIITTHNKIIVFYNYTYELEILRHICELNKIEYGEWNGEKHTDIPRSDRWAYLVQYSAGCEGWNCTETDTILFYSSSYSYRMTRQAEGRIDRMNTEFKDLYYYKIKSSASIDVAIARALREKKNFNESSFAIKTK